MTSESPGSDIAVSDAEDRQLEQTMRDLLAAPESVEREWWADYERERGAEATAALAKRLLWYQRRILAEPKPRATVSKAAAPLTNRAGEMPPEDVRRQRTPFEKFSGVIDDEGYAYERALARFERQRAEQRAREDAYEARRQAEHEQFVARLFDDNDPGQVAIRLKREEEKRANFLAGQEKARLTRLRKQAERVEVEAQIAVAVSELEAQRLEALQRQRAANYVIDRSAAHVRAAEPKPVPPVDPADAKHAQWCRANGIRVAGDESPYRSHWRSYGADSQPTCSLRSMPPPVPWSLVPVHISDLPIVTAPEWVVEQVEIRPPMPPPHPWLQNRVRRRRRHRKPVGDAQLYAEQIARYVETHGG